MVDTLEVRWFGTGTPPSPVVEWFRTIGAEAESARTDLYLLAEDPAVNVKLREGQVQVKHRLGEPSSIQFSDRAQGIQERWVKWCFPTEEQHHDLFDDDPTGLWIPVHKERMQLEIEASEQQEEIDSLLESDPALAKIELTEVRTGNHEAWTICVESEGRPDVLAGTLQQAGTHLFQLDSSPSLSTDHSFGYAHWLQQLDGPEVRKRSSPLLSP